MKTEKKSASSKKKGSASLEKAGSDCKQAPLTTDERKELEKLRKEKHAWLAEERKEEAALAAAKKEVMPDENLSFPLAQKVLIVSAVVCVVLVVIYIVSLS